MPDLSKVIELFDSLLPKKIRLHFLATIAALFSSASLIQLFEDFGWAEVLVSAQFLLVLFLASSYWGILIWRLYKAQRVVRFISVPILSFIATGLAFAVTVQAQYRYNPSGFYESRNWRDVTGSASTSQDFRWTIIAV